MAFSHLLPLFVRIRYQIAIALMVLVLVPVLLRVLRQVFLTMGERPICPQCGTTYIDPSRTHTLPDLFFRVLGLTAYRCHVCTARFYRPPIGG
jgi:hypothetical protein